jgi:hypothetical protein
MPKRFFNIFMDLPWSTETVGNKPEGKRRLKKDK